MGAGNGKFLTGLAVFRMGAVRQDFLSETKQEQSCFSGPKKSCCLFQGRVGKAPEDPRGRHALVVITQRWMCVFICLMQREISAVVIRVCFRFRRKKP